MMDVMIVMVLLVSDDQGPRVVQVRKGVRRAPNNTHVDRLRGSFVRTTITAVCTIVECVCVWIGRLDELQQRAIYVVLFW